MTEKKYECASHTDSVFPAGARYWYRGALRSQVARIYSVEYINVKASGSAPILVSRSPFSALFSSLSSSECPIAFATTVYKRGSQWVRPYNTQ